MAYFPFMIDISGRKCLVVGGGKVAFHKIKILLRFGVKIFAAAPLFSEEFPDEQILYIVLPSTFNREE